MTIQSGAWCPFCLSPLREGAVACSGCGAMRSPQSVNLVYLLVALPLGCFVLYYGIVALLPRNFPALVPLAVAVAAYCVAAYMHWVERQRVVWAVGAMAGGLVVFRDTAPLQPELIADKRCSDCAELVRRAARVCHWCGLRFEQAAPEHAKVSVEFATTVAPKLLPPDSRGEIEKSFPTPKPAWLGENEKSERAATVPAFSPSELSALSPMLALDALRDAGWSIDIEGQTFHVKGIEGFERRFEGMQAIKDWLTGLSSWNDVVAS